MIERRHQASRIELPISEPDIRDLVSAGDLSIEQARSYLELMAFRQGGGNRRGSIVVVDDTPDFQRPASFD